MFLYYSQIFNAGKKIENFTILRNGHSYCFNPHEPRLPSIEHRAVFNGEAQYCSPAMPSENLSLQSLGKCIPSLFYVVWSMNASVSEAPSTIISSLINFSSCAQLTNKCHMGRMSAFSALQNLGAFFSCRLHNRNPPRRVISGCVVIQAMWASQQWSVTSWNRPLRLVISRCDARSLGLSST